MEQKIEVETPLGPVWLWGRGDTGAPVLLLITGAFAKVDTLNRTGAALEGVDVWRAHLPGNHSPELAATSIGAYSAAFSHALNTRFPNRPTVVLGLSVGALVAMGLRNPQIQRLLLVEPPLRTEGVWPLLLLREQAPPGAETFLWNIFGIGPETTEPRDYSPLLNQLRIPSLVLVGQELLMPVRQSTIMPSLITDEVREALERHPLVRVVEAPGAGHNIPRRAGLLLVQTTLWACRSAFGPSVRLASSVDGAEPAP